MSGPKTSRLEIERRIRAQLAALRSDVDGARSRARRRIMELLEALLAEAAACEGGESIAADARALAEAALARLDAECAFEPCAVMQDSIDLAARCAEQAEAIADAFEAACVPLRERTERMRKREASHADEQDFAKLLAEAAARAGETKREAEIDAAENVATQALGTTVEQTSGATMDRASGATAGHVSHHGEENSSSAPSLSETVDAHALQAVAQRALALINSPHTLSADHAVLLQHAAALAPETAAQLALLLPSMETRAETLETLVAEAEDLEAQLHARGIPFARTSSFSTLEDAAAYVDGLRALQTQADENAYLQACIDEVMARHGYDIARSVRMGRDLAGRHRLYGSAGESAGIHAFVSDQGDLMLQIAGTPEGLDAVEEGAEVTLEAAPAGVRAERLLQEQRDFCAVYDEIAEELAEFGIVNAVSYRAEPDLAFSRDVRVAETAQKKTSPAHAQRRRAQTTKAAREMR